MPKSNLYALIMAGGRGTRFWPRSRKRHAKQVLTVFGDRSLLQQTVDRISAVVPAERTWILTNPDSRAEIVRQLPQLPKRQVIAEPAQRNTGPCNALAASILHSVDPDAVVGVFPADHVVRKPAMFTRVLKAGYRAAAGGSLVVVGIEPRWADTGYGYIEFPDGVQPGSLVPVPIRGFREKPERAVAEQYVASGRYYWNSGMFFWRAAAFLDAMRRYQPQIATLVASLPPFSSRSFASALAKAYPLCRDISVDYAIYERAEGVLGLPAGDLGWSDVGSWHAVYELLPHDQEANAVRGELLALDSRGSYVDAPGKLVALVGVENLVIVDTPDALLVADRTQAQRVGELVKRLERLHRDDLL